jgi:hypothetical protein
MSNVEYAKNLVYSSEDGSTIDCIIKFDTVAQELPFTASINDVEEHGRAIYQSCIDGVWGAISPYVPPPEKAPVATTDPVVI